MCQLVKRHLDGTQPVLRVSKRITLNHWTDTCRYQGAFKWTFSTQKTNDAISTTPQHRKRGVSSLVSPLNFLSYMCIGFPSTHLFFSFFFQSPKLAFSFSKKKKNGGNSQFRFVFLLDFHLRSFIS